MKNIRLSLPVKIPYAVMQQLLETKLAGMEIGMGKRKKGRILGTSMEASPLEEYDILLGLRVVPARKILLPGEVTVYIHGNLQYDPETGQLSVGTFKIQIKSRNLLMVKALEFLGNRMYYRKVLEKATVNLKDLIRPYRDQLNDKLGSGLATKDVVFHGKMDDISITRIEPDHEFIVVHARFEGCAEVTLQSVPFNDFSK